MDFTRCLTTILSVSLIINLQGCSGDSDDGPNPKYSTGLGDTTAVTTYNYDEVTPENIVFKDELSSNVAPPAGLEDLSFLDTTGQKVALKDLLGKKNVVLIFTQGFYGTLCPYCTTQTARLVANYEKFQELDTEILVVYPGEKSHLEEFIQAATKTEKNQVETVPFPLLLDEDLVAVDFFDIRSQSAHPSTYVIDKQGNVLLAYVGKDHTNDRPSVNRILESLKTEN
ncbi:peroxiredoxin family protein [Rubinisphaera italica]|uniref:thioredoxin-dependent peroxiredoxin n=1 Tax=Rubinisphaera italica TaxID=2527969 RepID=A0A5C5XJ41_9PLAN|nr:redoxin domain-containing protein [Rubinisphaera italica]TWT62814.1 Thiol-disulfide oxidoreductase ResA [Rubinisphaera italica]